MDMTRERDLLQHLLDTLSREYAKSGWQIEMVDLRWGISKEAGLENRTMQICEEELRRCQQLSPRPNFIILLGNRYGWIPLPERIVKAEVDQLKMTADEEILFDRWYRLDENFLPAGDFVLQRRCPPYDNDSLWAKEVEQPLREMFLRNEKAHTGLWNWIKRKTYHQIYGKSATEKEIEMGALSVADASEHVVAYFRNLADIPTKEEVVFCEKEKHLTRLLLELKHHIGACLSSENVYVDNLSYESYLSEGWRDRFVSEMEKRIRRVVDACILQYDQSVANDESKEHLHFALESASHFIGRESILTEINRYIQSPTENRPLWIKAHSGSGKTALMSKIVADYQYSHKIICRFCGLTSQTMDEGSFFTSLYNLIPHKREMPDYATPRYHLGDLLKKFKPTQPTLIVLDALNQLETQGFGLENFMWLNFTLHPNLKIIVSSTDELRFTKEPSFLSVIHLPNMQGDSELMVLDILQRNDRCLSSSQRAALNRVIGASDCSAIYLRMLGYYLIGVSSWEEIDRVPSDLRGLVKLMVDEWSQPERHGKEIVQTALNLFVCERLGLTDSEVQKLLSRDKSLVDFLQAHSFHSLSLTGEQRLPIVLWSRLRHDILPFLRSFTSVGGQMNTIFHSELRQVLRDYLDECHIEEHTARRLLFDYYKQYALECNKHALLEVIHCACYPHSPIVSEAVDFLKTHLDFLLTKYSLFPKELMKDFDELIQYTEEVNRRDIYELRNSIASLPVNVTTDQLLLYMMNQPRGSILHQLASLQMSYNTVLENTLADAQPKDTVVYSLSETGEKPCMSDDGTKIASLFQNRHEIHIVDLSKSWQDKIILKFNEEVLSMSCSEDMRLLLIRTGNVYAVHEVLSGRIIISCRLGEHPWASLSASGERFAFGDSTGTWAYELPRGMKAQLKASYRHMFSGCLSPSGNYLWLLQEDRTLYRIRWEGGAEKLSNLLFRSNDKQHEYIEGVLTDPQTAIVVSSDHCCVCYHDKWALNAISLDDGSAYTESKKFYLIGDSFAVISRDEKSVFYCTPPYSTVYHIENGHEVFVSQNYIDPQCVNRDLTLALWNGRVIDLQEQMKRFVVSDGNVGGINSLSASASGERAIISVGQNVGMERRWEVLKVEGQRIETWSPPFSNKDYQFVIASRVSPDGLCYVMSSHNMCSPSNELLLYRNDNDSHLCIPTGDSGCLGLDISKDSQYIVAMRGDYIADPDPIIYLLDKSGKLLREIPTKFPYTTKDGIRITGNNRYLIVLDWDTYSVFDLLSGDPIEINGQQTYPYESYSMAYGQHRPFFALLPLPQQPVLSTDVKNKRIFRLDLKSRKAYSIPFEMRLLAASPSGRILYLADENHRLYKLDYLSPGNPVPLIEHVQIVMSALDDIHIYVIKDDFTILLYNVATRLVEQQAYCGQMYFQTVCAQGLYVVNVNGDVSLLHPKEELHVNVPAVTTFTRHYNLDRKDTEQPSAICPMCGGTIGLTSELSKVLKDSDVPVSSKDWENLGLLGHHCPHCSAELQFTPYVI